tara:strand:- start:1435 stop:2058 length:624 start_codon:yes stop_codon:yes gene_type:complete
MTLLRAIFPCLNELVGIKIPKWNDENSPWEILEPNNGFLLEEQIRTLNLGDDSILIHPSAMVAESAVIEGPCYIGPNVVIRHGAYLRGGSWICNDSVVGNSSEIKSSLLLPGAKAPHFNYVGDSIIGANVNLGAGVKISNVRNDGGRVSVRLFNGERVQTNLRKMGALIGDGSQIGCNSVTNPGALIGPNSMINPNETVTGYFGTMS